MRSRAPAAAAVVALLWVIVARITGPSDTCEYAQPLTIAYTTDMLVNGRWVLPRAAGVAPATKPPLYNWLAAPAVYVAGFASETAHKAPSLLALVACFCLLVVVGRRWHDATLGWTAALVFCANHLAFKLGYLARPDMLLTLWVALGWMAATAFFAAAEPRPRLRLVFWACVGLAAITKGPPALLLLLYGLLAGRVVAGRWSATARLGWWWGLPAALAVFGLWIGGAALDDPAYVRDGLIGREVLGRITGTGPEGAAGRGPIVLLETAGHMPFYFLHRFAPWSLAAAWGIVLVCRRAATPPWVRGAGLLILVAIGFFTLSAGKRADYLAPCLVPAALLAAWVLVRAPRAIGGPITVSVVAALTLAAHTLVLHREAGKTLPGHGDGARELAAVARRALADEPAGLVFWETERSPLQSWMGRNEPQGFEPLRPYLLDGAPVYVIAGRRPDHPETFEAFWLNRVQPAAAWPAALLELEVARDRAGDPFAYLYRIEPVPEFNHPGTRFR